MENTNHTPQSSEESSVVNQTTPEQTTNTQTTGSEPIEFSSRLDLDGFNTSVDQIREQLSTVIVGQQKLIDLLIVALLSRGHVLLEGVPGVAKTLTIKSLAKTLGIDFSRIQFTPDLMPSDILGTSVFNLKESEFNFKKGPIFSNTILIDEINRAPAKTQAALFEVMEEYQITIDGTTYPLEQPFIVMATQNPIDQEGTYRLPEAQLDRFLFKLKVNYPTLQEELEVLEREHSFNGFDKTIELGAILDRNRIKELQDLVKQVIVEKPLLEYIGKIIHNTRNNPFLFLGASPRASIALLNASKAHALLEGRDFVTPEDIKQLVTPVLRHRIHITPEREMEGMTAEHIIEQIIEQIEIPR